MSEFLDLVRARAADAMKRLHASGLVLQQAQAEHQAAISESQSWQTILQAEERREATKKLSKAIFEELGSTPQQQESHPLPSQPSQAAVPTPASDQDINKSELIRQTLRDNPAGLRPAEVWHKLKEQIPNRSYVYSVLGRLKEREHVSVNKRGKYTLRITTAKGEEAKESLPLQ